MQTTRPVITRLLAALALGLPALTSHAHEAWIEDSSDGHLYVRFAEYGEDYEKSPGSLDFLMLPLAWTQAAAVKEAPLAPGAGRDAREMRDIEAGKVSPIDVKKLPDGFLLTGVTLDKAVQAEAGFTVMGKAGNPEKPARHPVFHTRWQPPGAGAAKPALDFDIVPTGKTGEACVYFRGKPLPAMKVTFYPAKGDAQNLVSDDAGVVHFNATAPGLYMLSAAHQRETVSGFFGGKAYDMISHNTSLAWRQP